LLLLTSAFVSEDTYTFSDILLEIVLSVSGVFYTPPIVPREMVGGYPGAIRRLRDK